MHIPLDSLVLGSSAKNWGQLLKEEKGIATESKQRIKIAPGKDKKWLQRQQCAIEENVSAPASPVKNRAVVLIWGPKDHNTDFTHADVILVALDN